jgi:nucleotide-binding universal stress UspA family protein
MATKEHRAPSQSAASSIFERVLVGVDPSPESREAVRQAAILVDPRGALTLLAAWTPPPSFLGVGVSAVVSENEAYEAAAERALRRADEEVGPPGLTRTRLVYGPASLALLDEIESERTTLAVVGSHGHGRMRGIMLGSTASELVHRAPCSVLVARRADAGFPRAVVVGLDGSHQSAAALAVARSIAARFGSDLLPVVAHGGKGVSREAVSALVDEWKALQDDPVTALTAVAADGDLVVVGSRGLHGVRALGSVSERVAHRVHCSTLVVRAAA